MQACLTAVEGGVARAHVIDGRLEHPFSLRSSLTRVSERWSTPMRMVNVMTNLNQQSSQRWASAMMANYATPEICLDRGEGARVWDVDGNEYLDLIAGIATSTLGHGNTAIADAVSDQVKRLAHTSNLFAHEPGLNLCREAD